VVALFVIMNTFLRHIIGLALGAAFALGLLLPQSAQAQELIISRETVKLEQDNVSTSATISWFTNLAADGRVDYGPTTSYGNYVASSIVTDYREVILSSLKSETTYHFKLTSVTPTGERLESFDQTFKTLKFTNKVPPAITDVQLGGVSATYFVVQWMTDELSDSRVEFSTDAAFKRPGSAGGNANTTMHEVVVGRLKPATTYYYRARSRDKDKNFAVGAIRQATTLPNDQSNERELLAIRQVSPVSFPDPAITDTTVTFTWKTSRLAKGHVDMRGVRVPSKRLSETGFLTTEHQLTITGLKSASRYVVKIYAKDALGKSVTTGEIHLTTDPTRPVPKSPTGAVGGAVCRGPYVYAAPCRDLAAERALAVELRQYLRSVFQGRVPASVRQNWYTLVNAYAYGGYSTEAIVQSVKHGGKTVHPTIPWSEWKNSRDYKAYIAR